jgi:hypothetical protein
MKKHLLLVPVAFLMLATACKKDENNPVNPPATNAPNDSTSYTGATVTRTTNNSTATELADGATLQGSITANTTLKSGRTYNLKGFVFVRNGATLKIEPGVTIKGDKTSKATLIITRNGKIDAQGTSSSPIVFTSAQTSPDRGDWGGVIILGNAHTNGQYNGNTGVQAIEGGVNTTTEGYGLHGGTNDEDNSGTIKYVRIEYGGVAFATDNEINGLTMGSVGRGTTLENIEVFKSNDDAFEWFGGTVNAKYLVAISSSDDDFDTDNGYSGKVQYGISVRDNQVADFAAGGTSNGFESDNDATGTTATPQTRAMFSNFTMVGPKAQAGNPAIQFGRGAHIRRNSAESIFNTVFIGWNTGLRIDGKATNDNFVAGTAKFKNNVIANAGKNVDTAGVVSSTTPIDPSAFFSANSNVALADVAMVMLSNVALGASFSAVPMGGSPILSGAGFTDLTPVGFFEQTSYVGAVSGSSSAWYQGWTRFN